MNEKKTRKEGHFMGDKDLSHDIQPITHESGSAARGEGGDSEPLFPKQGAMGERKGVSGFHESPRSVQKKQGRGGGMKTREKGNQKKDKQVHT